MDTPRKWQVASLATAVASISIGGLLLARPSSEAVASIDLELVTDSRDLSIASPGSSAVSPAVSLDAPQIVSPEAIEGPVPSTAPSATSVDSPDEATNSGTVGTTSSSGGTEPSQPAPSTPSAQLESPSSADSPGSVDSLSSIDL